MSSASSSGGEITAYMTHREAARIKGVALSAIYEAVNRGNIATAEVFDKTVLTRASVEAWQPRPNRRRKPARIEEEGPKGRG